MARGKNPCKVCQDRPANVKGGICWVCAETDEGKAFLAGVKPPEEPKIVLTDTRTDDYTAMQHVWEGQRPCTKQQKAFQGLLKADGPAKFWDRMERSKSTSASSSSANSPVTATAPQLPTWNGTGPCPTCHRVPEAELPGPEYMEPEWDEVLRISKLGST